MAATGRTLGRGQVLSTHTAGFLEIYENPGKALKIMENLNFPDEGTYHNEAISCLKRKLIFLRIDGVRGTARIGINDIKVGQQNVRISDKNKKIMMSSCARNRAQSQKQDLKWTSVWRATYVDFSRK